MGFGYKRQESVQALKKAKESGATTVEEILRKALQMGF
jgi:Holliday junction resolvasome RuvABC DNA-binding subunit